MENINDRRTSARESKILSSEWTGLSPHLIAAQPVDQDALRNQIQGNRNQSYRNKKQAENRRR